MKNRIKLYFLIILASIYFIFVVLSFFFPDYFLTSKQITKKDIILYHRYLSDDNLNGRYPSTTDSKKVQNWIISFFKKWNYKPLFDNQYFLEFSFSGNYKKSGINELQVIHCKSNCIASIEPLGFSSSGEIVGKVIDGNYCIEENKDLSNLLKKISNPKEYIVICKRLGPEKDKNKKQIISLENKYKNINRLNFKGVLFLKDKENPIKIEQFQVSSKGNTIAAFFDNEEYIEIYKKILKPDQEVRIVVNYEREKLTGRNLGFSLKPVRENQKIIYIGAHYDHLGKGIAGFSLGPFGEIYNGADDNASGVAGVMEIAEFFSNEKIPEDWNLIFLFFDAEEWGLLGSKEFVHSKYISKNAVAMLNFDMIGRYKQSLQLQGKDTGDITWNEILEKTVQKIQSKYLLQVQYVKGGSGPSDHTMFYNKGIPVLFFFTGIHEDYHKPTDDYYKINYIKMVEILELAKEIIIQIMNSKNIPKYVKAQEENKHYTYNIRLGIIPSNYFSDQGIEVGGFVEDAPIGKSGIQIGDIIIKIENKEIQNIHNLMEFLQNAKLGIKYKITYRRNNQILETYTELIGR